MRNIASKPSILKESIRRNIVWCGGQVVLVQLRIKYEQFYSLA